MRAIIELFLLLLIVMGLVIGSLSSSGFEKSSNDNSGVKVYDENGVPMKI